MWYDAEFPRQVPAADSGCQDVFIPHVADLEMSDDDDTLSDVSVDGSDYDRERRRKKGKLTKVK